MCKERLTFSLSNLDIHRRELVTINLLNFERAISVSFISPYINCEAIKYRLESPLQPAPRSGATGGRRCVVGTHCA